ncbi:hypothetical protein [Aliiroseovarius marinus]|uniref:hypothetical protein n=1 Tax=Aliiroseovarius marinus TaxID=2500159 RepID=UPI003D7DAC34
MMSQSGGAKQAPYLFTGRWIKNMYLGARTQRTLHPASGGYRTTVNNHFCPVYIQKNWQMIHIAPPMLSVMCGAKGIISIDFANMAAR